MLKKGYLSCVFKVNFEAAPVPVLIENTEQADKYANEYGVDNVPPN